MKVEMIKKSWLILIAIILVIIYLFYHKRVYELFETVITLDDYKNALERGSLFKIESSPIELTPSLNNETILESIYQKKMKINGVQAKTEDNQDILYEYSNIYQLKDNLNHIIQFNGDYLIPPTDSTKKSVDPLYGSFMFSMNVPVQVINQNGNMFIKNGNVFFQPTFGLRNTMLLTPMENVVGEVVSTKEVFMTLKDKNGRTLRDGNTKSFTIMNEMNVGDLPLPSLDVKNTFNIEDFTYLYLQVYYYTNDNTYIKYQIHSNKLQLSIFVDDELYYSYYVRLETRTFKDGLGNEVVYQLIPVVPTNDNLTQFVGGILVKLFGNNPPPATNVSATNATGTNETATNATGTNASGTSTNASGTGTNASGTGTNASGTNASGTGTNASATNATGTNASGTNASATNASGTGTGTNVSRTNASGTGTEDNSAEDNQQGRNVPVWGDSGELVELENVPSGFNVIDSRRLGENSEPITQNFYIFG